MAATDFKNLNPEALPKRSTFLTNEQLYWKQYSLPVTVKDSYLIQNVDISTEDPYQFAISSSNRVQIYNPVSRDVTCRLTKFKLNAFGAKFRGDNKLLAAGSDEGIVKLFDIKTKALLRQFVGHNQATRKVDFINSTSQVVSFSDDQTVALWDIPQQSKIVSCQHHKDYIRCGRVCPNSQNLVLAGSYDHTASIIDLRTGEPALVVDHGHPIESVEMLPSGSIFFTAGSNLIKVWDAASGKKIMQLCQHHKAVTCLAVSSCGNKLLSGSLDRHVKIYDVVNYQVVHSLSYPSPILCMGMSKDASVFVVGSETGLITIHRKKEAKVETETDGKDKIKQVNFVADSDDVVFDTMHHAAPNKLHSQLRRFEFTAALQTAFNESIHHKKPELFIATCEEVARRRMLEQSLAKLSEKYQNSIIDFICKYVSVPRYESVLIDLIMVLTRVLQDRKEWDDVLWLKLEELQANINKLHDVQLKCKTLIGMIDSITMQAHQSETADLYLS